MFSLFGDLMFGFKLNKPITQQIDLYLKTSKIDEKE